MSQKHKAHYPKLSVFIPAKNEVDYIGNILSDLRDQTYQAELKIFVVDAESKDGTRSICEKYRVPIVEGGEVNYARNKGMKTANHELVAMLDADVRIGPNFLEIAVKEFQRRNLDIATARNVPFTKVSISWVKKLAIHAGWNAAHVYQWIKQFSSHPRLTSTFVLLKKSAWRKVGGFDESIRMGGDTDFVIRAANHDQLFRYLHNVSVRV